MAGSKKSVTKQDTPSSPHDTILAEAKDALTSGEAERAIALVTRAIGTDPENPALLAARGAVHAIRTGEWPSWKSQYDARRAASFKRSVQDYDAAIALAPDYAEAYLGRALARQHLIDREGASADFTRAIELGLDHICLLQAHSCRSQGSDIEIVNIMRKVRGTGQDWRHSTPLLATIRGALPLPPAAGAPEASGRKTPAAKKPAAGRASANEVASPEPPRTSTGEVDWIALGKRVDAARKSAIQEAAQGGAAKPDDIVRDLWLSGFDAEVRPGVRVFLDPPPGGDLWRKAVAAVGKKNEAALARAIATRRVSPFFHSTPYLHGALAALAGDGDSLADCAHTYLLEVERMENYRHGMEHAIEALAAVVPTAKLRPESIALIDSISASAKYRPIAEPLRRWAGLGKVSARKKAEAAAADLALHAPTVEAFKHIVLEATTKNDVPRLRRLHKKLEELDLLTAGDHPVHRRTIDGLIESLRERLAEAPPAARRVIENMLDTATSS